MNIKTHGLSIEMTVDEFNQLPNVLVVKTRKYVKHGKYKK